MCPSLRAARCPGRSPYPFDAVAHFELLHVVVHFCCVASLYDCSDALSPMRIISREMSSRSLASHWLRVGHWMG